MSVPRLLMSLLRKKVGPLSSDRLQRPTARRFAIHALLPQTKDSVPCQFPGELEGGGIPKLSEPIS
jgi:hypothetical protein